MPHNFYLSYASADYGDDLCGFFEDLSHVVQTRLRLPESEPVGFFNTQGIAPGSEWRPDVAKALRTSRTMLALVSPAYIRSESAGKEWQVFENRRHLDTLREAIDPPRVVPQAIAPVLWIPCSGQMPHAISKAPWILGDSDSAYNRNGLLKVRGSANRFQQDYADSLAALAEQIVQMSRNSNLPPLDTLPPFAEVDNLFKYNAIIVEGHDQVRKMLVEYLEASNFEVQAYQSAGEVPSELLEEKNQINPIDLFVVDLEFESPGTDGLDLIEKISAIETRPAIMAMSASLSSNNLIEAMKMGAEDVVPKPFEVSEIVERMRNLASIGRNRRLRQQGQSLSDSEDPSRFRRPVFLSYSSEDNGRKGVAAFLRSNIEAMGIGVYYADDSRLPEDSQEAKRILEAIDQAHVYLPLITEKYPCSNYCLSELVRFCTHVEPGRPGSSSMVRTASTTRTLLPVLYGLPNEIKNYEWIRPIIDERRHANITSDQFLDGLIALLGWIRNAVNEHEVP
jgi:DNA-binding NarL/FixJ family response regulator